MKTITVMSVVLMAAVLAGCASNAVWTKPGASTTQFEQDKAKCLMRGQQAEASTIGYNGFLAGYEKAQTAQLCMQAHGWSRMSKSSVMAAERSRVIWVKSHPYSRATRDSDQADCEKLNPNADGVAPCMQKRGYIGLTAGQLHDAEQKALASGLISKSVSSQAESEARAQKVIDLVLSRKE